VRRLIPDSFILALLTTVALAIVLPAQGSVAGAVDILATAAIVLLFFLHGVRIPREAVLASLRHWRLHSAILGSTFVAFPLLGLGMQASAGSLLPQPFLLGVLFLCALPSTVQSSIAFTSIARGNVAGAVAAATISNLLGMLLTPLLVSLLLHSQGAGFSASGVGKIFSQLLLPFVVGQLVRPWLGAWAARRKKLLTLTDRGTIVLAVYSAFSAAVTEGVMRNVPVSVLGILFLFCCVLLCAILFITSAGSRLLGFDREDEIAIVFCGSKKTLASGIPMARVLFSGPDLGAIVLPLMMFHQLQLMACAWLARRYAASPLSPAFAANP